MELTLNPYQSEFLFSKARFPALVTAIGCGKTMMLLLKVWNFCETYPNSLVLVVRKEFTDLRDSTMKDFERYFGVRANSNKEYEFENGSVILFRHGGELNVLKNLNLSMFAIEQAEEFETEEAFVMLRDRLRRENAPIRQGCIIANACGHNWIWRFWKQRDDPAYPLWEACSFDNAHNLPSDFIEDLRRMEHEAPRHYAQYVMNSWDDVDSAGDLVIEYQDVLESVDRKPFNSLLKRVVYCDVAEGTGTGDETVIYCCENERIIDTHISRVDDPMGTAGNIYTMAKNNGATDIGCDAVGVGAGVFSQLLRLTENDPIKVHPFKGGNRATRPDLYVNMNAQVWWNAREVFGKKLASIPDDPILIDQLSAMPYRINKKDRIEVLKDKCKEKIGCSPDRAEAYIGCLWLLEFATPVSKFHGWNVEQFRKMPETNITYETVTHFN